MTMLGSFRPRGSRQIRTATPLGDHHGCDESTTVQRVILDQTPSQRFRLRDIFADVGRQDLVDERLVPDTPAACFLAKLFEHSRIDANGDQLTGFIAQGRPTDAAHGLQLFRR
jgi:hypothetical protein